MTAVIFRRRRLGNNSTRTMAAHSETGITVRTHNPLRRTAAREGPWPDDTSLVIRWGCTARIPVDCNRVVNTTESIHRVNNKAGFRMLLNEHELCPTTWTSWNDFNISILSNQFPPREIDYPRQFLLRPATHSQGRHFHLFSDTTALGRLVRTYGPGNYYISELVNKSSEYRVFVCQGRAVWVARKTPGNPDDVAWNVARGGRFDNVRWGDWPLRVVRVAIEAFNLSGLDFGGVDVIVDQEGRAYVIEINSAPSQTSPYRQQATAAVLDYIVRHGKGNIHLIQERGGWRKFIHPALSQEAQIGEH